MAVELENPTFPPLPMTGGGGVSWAILLAATLLLRGRRHPVPDRPPSPCLRRVSRADQRSAVESRNAAALDRCTLALGEGRFLANATLNGSPLAPVVS